MRWRRPDGAALMDALHKFIFDGLPVRGMLVRLESSWQELQRRHDADRGYAPPVRALLGQMCAAGVLMHANIKFDGALVLQVFGDGPVRLAVADVQPDLCFRATAKVVGAVADDARLEDMVNVQGQGRCAITLDPLDKQRGQQPYQGVVALHGDRHQPLQRLSDVLEHYMLQSEQLDTRLVLAADERRAAGLLIQRLPVGGAEGAAQRRRDIDEHRIGRDEDYNRIARLAASLTEDELLTLDDQTLLRRLFWDERLLGFEPLVPRFGCSCSNDRVRAMLLGLGQAEVQSIVAERGEVEIVCDFCGQPYRFDPVDAAGLFMPGRDRPPGSDKVQ